MKKIRCAIALFSFIICATNFAFGQCDKDVEKLFPTPIIDGLNGFGNNIVLDGNIAVVGANKSDSLNKLGGMVYVYEYQIDKWVNIASLLPSDPVPDSHIGSSIDISGNTIVVGFPGSKEKGFNAGVVYVYEKPDDGIWKTTTETYKVYANTSNMHPLFGQSVSLMNDYLLIGAPFEEFAEDQGKGAAYLFQKVDNRFVKIAKFVPSMSERRNYFGGSVKFSENLIVIGTLEDYSENHAGALYVYDRPSTGWISTTETAKLTATNSYASDPRLGTSISIYENTILAGAPRYAIGDNFWAGAAFIYEKPVDGWKNDTETAMLSFSQGGNGQFGMSVHLEKDHAYIGNPYRFDPNISIFKKPSTGWKTATEDDVITSSMPNDFGYSFALNEQHLLVGSPVISSSTQISTVSCFKKPATGWSNQTPLNQTITMTKLNASESSFGHTVAVHGNFMVVGAPGDAEKGIAAGAAYVFEYNGSEWIKVAKLMASDGSEWDRFGISVSIGEDQIVVGSSLSDLHQNGSIIKYDIGAVYVFKKTSTGWHNNIESQKIQLNNIEDGARFGFALDLDKDYLVVTRYNEGDSESKKRAYIFKYQNEFWSQIAELKITDSRSDFGRSVAIQDNTIVVGSGRMHFFQIDHTYAYVFSKGMNEWKDTTETAILSTNEDKPGQLFGYSVGINNDEIIVGAPAYSNNFKMSGCAFIYKKPSDGWKSMTETVRLTASEEVEGRNLGYSVSLNDQTALVGGPYILKYVPNNISPSGEVFVYQKPANGWMDVKEYEVIKADDEQKNNFFGSPVGFWKHSIFVGAVYDNNSTGNSAGTVYVYKYQVTKPSLLAEDSRFSACGGGNLRIFSSIKDAENYEWFFANNMQEDFILVKEGPDAVFLNPTQSGFYKLRIYWGECTFDSDLKEVYFDQTEEIKIMSTEPGFSFCSGEDVNLYTTFETGDRYEWFFTNNEHGEFNIFEEGVDAFSIKPLKSGFYKLKVYSGDCVSDSDVKEVYIGLKEEIEIMPAEHNHSFCSGDDFQLYTNFKTGDLYEWHYSEEPEGQFNVIQQNNQLTLIPDKSGYYKLVVYKNGCSNQSLSKKIIIKEKLDFLVPNVITPNGDGVNDSFEIKNLRERKAVLSIYNRWGKLVYTSDDYKNDWDGENGNGILYYHLYLKDECFDNEPRKGWLQVLK